MSAQDLPEIIKKSYELVFTQQDLSSTEANLFALMIAHMRPSDWNNLTIKNPAPIYEFSSKQIRNWLGLSESNVSYFLNGVCNRLTKRNIGAFVKDKKTGEICFDYAPIMKLATYRKKTLILIPNDILMEQYVSYSKGFSLINTVSYLALKREYTKRLYEILSQFKKGNTRVFSIYELKGYFGLYTEDKNQKPILKKNKQSYESNYLFVKRCIKESIEELENDDRTKNEIQFHVSESGSKGYKTNKTKNSNELESIEFLYTFINGEDSPQEINPDQAIENIKTLEMKRANAQNRLTNDELALLSSSYAVIGKHDIAKKIQDAIDKRYQDELLKKQEEDALKYLDAASRLYEMNKDIDY